MIRHKSGVFSAILATCAAAATLLTPRSAIAQIPHSGQFLRDYAETNRFRLGNPTAFHITPDGTGVLFLRAAGPRTFRQDLWWFDVATTSERMLLTADHLTGSTEENLTPEELARRERARSSSRGIASYELSKDGKTLLVPVSGRVFVVDLASALGGAPVVRELKSTHGSAIDARFSPDAAMVACVRDGALLVTRVSDGVERRVSPEAEGEVTYAEAEFVAQEEMDRSQGYWWSPDGGAIAYQRTDVTGVEKFTIADPFDPSKPAKTWAYPRAGKKNAEVTLWVADVRGQFEAGAPDAQEGREKEEKEEGVAASERRGTQESRGTQVQWDHEKYPYLAKVTWAKNAPLCVLVQNRTQTEQVFYRVDTATGAATEVLRENDAEWINLNPSSPTWMEDGESFLWMTEQPATEDARKYNSADMWTMERHFLGSDPARCVAYAFDGIRRVLSVNPDNYLVYSAGTQVQPWGALTAHDLRGDAQGGAGGVVGVLGDVSSKSPGVEDAVIGAKGGLMVRTSHDLRGSLRWIVERVAVEGDKDSRKRTVKTPQVGEIASRADAPPFTPSVELVGLSLPGVIEGTDLINQASVTIIRPRDFDPTQKYPVLDFAYAGPHSKTVNAAARNYLLHQWYADQGFIVVCIDGRGTPDKGRAWERAIKNNLIDAALSDHCAALEELCKQYPDMDRSRIGVNGWSFGGYFAAMAVMRRPDVYKAGVAGAPVVDWRDYDTHYTERYMGIPLPADQLTDGVPGNEAGYDASCVLTYAKDLSVPFLLIHGTADDNVYFVHSMKLCDALVRAKKDFEFMPLPGQTHAVSKPEWVEAVQSRIAGFFREHLRPD